VPADEDGSDFAAELGEDSDGAIAEEEEDFFFFDASYGLYGHSTSPNYKAR
jgi:hypothetical protein